MKNVSLKLFREFLKSKGLVLDRYNGGHEIWERDDLKRPIVIQSHIDPIPDHIISGCLRTLGTNKKDLEKFAKQ